MPSRLLALTLLPLLWASSAFAQDDGSSDSSVFHPSTLGSVSGGSRLPPGVSPPVFITGGERPLIQKRLLSWPPNIFPAWLTKGVGRLNVRNDLLPPADAPPLTFTTGGERPLVEKRDSASPPVLDKDEKHHLMFSSSHECWYESLSEDSPDSAKCPTISCDAVFADHRSCTAWQKRHGQASSMLDAFQDASQAQILGDLKPRSLHKQDAWGSAKPMDKCQHILCLSIFLANLDCGSCSATIAAADRKWRGDRLFKDGALGELPWN